MERNVAGADCPLVCLREACQLNESSAELRRQLSDAQHVADAEKLDVPSLVAMTANTTL